MRVILADNSGSRGRPRPALLGRDAIKKFGIDWGNLAAHLEDDFSSLYQPQLGQMAVSVRLELVEQAKLRFGRARSVPFAYREVIEKELKRMEEQGLIYRVPYSEWVTPIVAVPKADGSVRLCGDYKVTINPVLKVTQYPLPTPEDSFATLNGGTVFF